MRGWEWSYAHAVRFLELLALPDGRPLRLEPFQRLILRMVFRLGLVELLVLLPKGNGKTTLFAGLAVFHLLVTPNAECYIGAADREQANIMYRFAQHFVDSEPELEALLLVRASTKEIRSKRDQGFIKVLASDDSRAGGKRQGLNPTLFLVDELHAHENSNLYVAGRSGAFKRGGTVMVISTAGHDVHSVLGRLRAQMLDAPSTGGLLRQGLRVNGEGNPDQGDGRLSIAETRSGRTVMLEWALRPDDDWTDPRVVKLASPASFVTVGSIEDAREAPGITPWLFKRYFCNLWTLGYESWLPEGAWDRLRDEHARIPVGSEGVAAVDMARYQDSAAVVSLWPREDGTVLAKARIWKSGGPDNPVPYSAPESYLRDLHREHDLRVVGYDPKYFDKSAEDLQADGLMMAEFPQSNERMCLAAAALRDAIVGHQDEPPVLRHDGDPEFSAQVVSAVAKEMGDSDFKLVKPRQRHTDGEGTGTVLIDACVALAMANKLLVDGTGRSVYEDHGLLVL